MGHPASPFIDKGKAQVTEEEKEKKDSATLEAFFSLVLFLFLLCNPRFSFAYKRGSRVPHEREEDLGDLDIRARHEHTAERQASSQHPFTPSTRDLGSSLSRLFVTPTENQVPVTRAAAN